MTENAKKFCSACGPQPVSEFTKDASRSDGLAGYCKRCKSLIGQEYYAGHADEINRKHREGYAANREERRKRQQEAYKRRREVF